MIAVLCLLKVLLCASFVQSLPSLVKKDALPSTFASDASQLIATQMLKHYNDIDGNQVHSPVGVAGILAVLAEASEGETYAEFATVFGFPQQRSELRKAFERTLSRYQNRDATLSLPSFQTWLYVYRNSTVCEDYKQLLQRHYYVEVKDINQQNYEWDELNTPLHLDNHGANSDTPKPSNSKDVIGFETLKRINLDDDGAVGPSNKFGEEAFNKEASKFDRDVDDKQYVEKPVALAEAEQLKKKWEQEQLITESTIEATESPVVEKQEKPAEIEVAPEENVAVKQEQNTLGENIKENSNVDNETALKTEKPSKVPAASEAENVLISLQNLENAAKALVTKQSQDSHKNVVREASRSRSLFGKDDIASALSANSITGRAIDSKFKMLLFNGLYYRGSWAQPFYQLRDGSDEFFFMTNDAAMKASMMHARGEFRVADMPHLKARVLSLPYENAKYGLCILLPNDAEGLNDVISQMQTSDFNFAKEHAQLKKLHVTLPKFQVEETAYSEAMLKELGLKRLFSRTEAQLGLLSEDQDVHVDEIVQFVNVRVDEGGSSANALSTSTTHARTPIGAEDATILPVPEPEPEPGVERFDIDRPFAYFIMDCENQFVLASGKIFAPEFKDELPAVSVEVELEQS